MRPGNIGHLASGNIGCGNTIHRLAGDRLTRQQFDNNRADNVIDLIIRHGDQSIDGHIAGVDHQVTVIQYVTGLSEAAFQDVFHNQQRWINIRFGAHGFAIRPRNNRCVIIEALCCRRIGDEAQVHIRRCNRVTGCAFEVIRWCQAGRNGAIHCGYPVICDRERPGDRRRTGIDHQVAVSEDIIHRIVEALIGTFDNHQRRGCLHFSGDRLFNRVRNNIITVVTTLRLGDIRHAACQYIGFCDNIAAGTHDHGSWGKTGCIRAGDLIDPVICHCNWSGDGNIAVIDDIIGIGQDIADRCKRVLISKLEDQQRWVRRDTRRHRYGCRQGIDRIVVIVSPGCGHIGDTARCQICCQNRVTGRTGDKCTWRQAVNRWTIDRTDLIIVHAEGTGQCHVAGIDHKVAVIDGFTRYAVSHLISRLDQQ